MTWIVPVWTDSLDNPPDSARIPIVKTTRQGLGCLILFALPFAVVGLIVFAMAARMLWLWMEVREWQPVPAQIVRAELITSTGDDSTTYEVEATYTYELDGQVYQGDRTGLTVGSDNIGSFHEDAYQELARHQSTGESFPCYVNPEDPSEAILFSEMRWGLLALMGVFGMIFTGAGVGLMVGGVVGKRRLEEEEHRAAEHPEEPWRWKREWVDGRITATGRTQFLLPAFMAVFWNLVSTPLLFVIPNEVRDKGNYLALIGLIFPAIGAGLTIWAIRSFIRWRKFGDSVLELTTFPGVLGGPLAGRILTSVNIAASSGFRLILSNIQRVTRGSGKNRSTRETVLWRQERHLQRESAAFDPTRSEIPVDFQIPCDTTPTEVRSEDDETLWRLEVAADVTGIDYGARFEVPVFETTASQQHPPPADGYGGWAEAEPPPIDLAAHGIDSELLSTGATRLTFRAARHKGPALMLTGFLVLWLGFNYLLIHLDAPTFFPVLWGLFSLLLFFGVLDLWFASSQIEIHPDRLVLQGGLFGLGRRREIPRTAIREIKPVRGMQSGDKLFYRLQIVTQEDQKLIAASKLENLSLARAILQKLE